MNNFYVVERAGARQILADASREKQKGIQGQWQQESSFREVLKQVERNAGTDCAPQMMRRAYIAMKHGNWESFKEEYREEEKSSEWTLERIREACEKVATDGIGRLAIVQEILRKSTDVLRRVIAPVGGMGGIALSYVCPHCNRYLVSIDRTRRQQQQEEEALQQVVRGMWRPTQMS